MTSGPNLYPPSVQGSQGPGLSSASKAVTAFTCGLPGPSLSTALRSGPLLPTALPLLPCSRDPTTNIPILQIIPSPLWPEGVPSFPQWS